MNETVLHLRDSPMQQLAERARRLKIEPGKDPGAPTFEVTMQLRNRGARAGAEVVQLYVHDGHASIDRPVKELKGFRRVELAPGKSATVSFTLDKSSMAFFSIQKKEWVAEPGKFDVLLGSSSADIRLKGSLELQR